MVQKRKIATRLLLITALTAVDPVLRGSFAEANPQEPRKSLQKGPDPLLADALRLLTNEASKPRPDWMVTATANEGRWGFSIMYAKSKNLLLPVIKDGSSASAVPLPPLSDLVVPQDASVGLIVMSNDDIHSFEVSGLGIKIEAVPGRIAQVTIDTTKPGVYPAICAEPCGPRDKAMAFRIHIVDLVTFQYWLATKHAADAGQSKR